MPRRILTTLLFSCLITRASAQSDTIPVGRNDTIVPKELEEVIVRAYEQNRRLTDVAGGVNYIGREALNRFSNTNILPALNATSGVRMEERSPGSYRLSIRGSSLRAPFGVRNVKVYYNDIPFTDPGGSTYINQLGFYNFGSIEVLKGPGSSLYGAGTGGVVLAESDYLLRKRGVTIAHTTGSYNLQNSNINVNTGTDSLRLVVNYQHQTSDGYREHSKLRRDIFSWEVHSRINDKDRLIGTFLYGDLYYQTPGALTGTEYEQNPKAARPSNGSIPGAKEAQAAVYQKMFLAGLSYEKRITANWKNTSTVYGTYTRLHNPAIRNYARGLQPSTGGRTVFEYRKQLSTSSFQWHTGAELQMGNASVRTYRNNRGNVDTLQTDEEIDVTTYFAFTQLTYSYKGWIGTAGLSFNKSTLGYSRLHNVPTAHYELSFRNEIAPRLSLLRKITNQMSAYATWSNGFSPPTTEEVFPTGSLSNPDLAAENGTNYEVGVKGQTLNKKLSFDISAFYFSLHNTIVQRRDAAGGDYYTNAGSTKQHGLETQLNYRLFGNTVAGASLNLWINHAWYDFSYRQFKQLNNDFSGKDLPGVPKHNLTAGIDYRSSFGGYANITYQYADPVALNDANSAYATSYNLLGARVGYRRSFGRINADVFAGADNLFDVQYSLGNDLNAFGGRFYNAAPGRNYFGGVVVGFSY